MITPHKPELKGTDIFTTQQAADVLGVHRNTLLRWSNDGLLFFKVGSNGRRYYRGLELMRMWSHQHNRL